METSDCLDSRLFWAIILWSWCGVQASEDGAVVIKDETGWVKTDAKGKPIYAKLKDLRELLGLSPAMAGSLSRAAARLEEVGSIRFGDTIPGCRGAKILYPIQEPARQKESTFACTANLEVWHIGTRVVSTATFEHLDSVACTELKAELDQASTEWLSDLKAARTKADEMVVQALSRRGILIERSSKSRLAKTHPPASQPASEEPPPPEEPKPAGRLVEEVYQNGSPTPDPVPEERVPVREYLETIPQPGLTPEIVREIEEHITTPEVLEQFKEETVPDKVQKAQTWKYFVSIAKRVAADAPRYAAAKAGAGNGHSPPKKPLTRSEQAREDWVREFKSRREGKGGGT
jgi:hypothetical protein